MKKIITLIICVSVLSSIVVLSACSKQTDEVLKKNGDSYTKLPLQGSTTKEND